MIMAREEPPRFSRGQLVRHKRYGYRGVIVEFDSHCRAPEEWVQSNQTQPDRAQPWYHVLVHGATSVTYAAQTSLDEDPSGERVEHPLVDQFFESFEGGHYVRNDRPWQGW